MAASKPTQKVAKAEAPLRIKVKFLTDCDPGNNKPVFKKGSIRELVISSANHWVRRGKAVKYVEPPKKAKPAKPKSAKSTGRRKNLIAKVKPIAVGGISEEAPDEETPDKEPEVEEKKTEGGESFGGMGDLMD